MIDVDSHDTTQDAGVVQVAITVRADPTETWRQIGDFASAGRFIGLPSVVTSGNGNVGSLRDVGDGVTEKMVAQGERFYVYEQTRGPMAEYGYHGCLAVEGSAEESIIYYTLVYDADALEPSAQRTTHAGLVERFQGAVEAMAREVHNGTEAVPR
jgi:hypothetical protein